MSSDKRQRSEQLGKLMSAMRVLSDTDVLFSQALADRLGLNLTDFKSSSILDWNGPMPAGRLAELTGLTTGAITGVLDRLEKSGWVKRAKDPVDRRHVIVQGVPDHAPKFAALLGPLRDGVQKITEGYDEAQLAVIVEFVGRASELLRAETARLRQLDPRPGDTPESAPLGSARRGVLRFATGAAHVTLDAHAPAALLYRARFTGRVPGVKVQDGVVTVQYPRFSLLDFRKLGAVLSLNAQIPWELELAGGVSRMRAELDELRLAALSIRGGASEVEIELPRPVGVVPLRVVGGASRILLRRPAGAAMRAEVHGGVSALSFDTQLLGAVGGVARLESPGFAEARNRYELEITGGASRLTVQTVGA